jgi:hypothetical protein
MAGLTNKIDIPTAKPANILLQVSTFGLKVKKLMTTITIAKIAINRKRYSFFIQDLN